MPEAHMIRPGVWKVRHYVGDGKVRSRTFDAPSEQAARRKVPRILTEIEDAYASEAAQVAAAAAHRDTVAGLVDDWQSEQVAIGRSPSYIARNSLICDRIRERLGSLAITAVTPADCNEFYRWLRTLPGRGGHGQMTEATVMRHHRVLDAVFRMAEEEDRILSAPTRRARKPRPLDHEVDLPDDTLIAELVESVPAHLRIAVTLDATTGLRRGELFGLRWGDVDLDGRVLRVRNNTIKVGTVRHDRLPKGKRTRDVPLTTTTAALLTDWRNTVSAALNQLGHRLDGAVRVLPDLEADPTGRTPLDPDWLSQAWMRHARRSGVRVRLHDLRHWYATRLLDSGVPVNDVADALGHAKASTTTDIYGHARRDHDRIRAALDATG